MDDITDLSTVNVRAIVDAPDHDEPYRFGRRPTVGAPFPFTDRQFARLLILRGRLRDLGFNADRPAA
jgi:hypothetical protein